MYKQQDCCSSACPCPNISLQIQRGPQGEPGQQGPPAPQFFAQFTTASEDLIVDPDFTVPWQVRPISIGDPLQIVGGNLQVNVTGLYLVQWSIYAILDDTQFSVTGSLVTVPDLTPLPTSFAMNTFPAAAGGAAFNTLDGATFVTLVAGWTVALQLGADPGVALGIPPDSTVSGHVEFQLLSS